MSSDMQAQETLSNRHLLVLRFAIINVVAFSLLGALYAGGWLDGALAGYTRWLSLAIFAAFLYGLTVCGARIWHISTEIDALRSGAPAPTSRAGLYIATVSGRTPESRAITADLLRIELSHRTAGVRHIASSLVLLGLIGTVIGFIVALSGVDPAASATTDSVAPMVAMLIKGMSIALYTTLIGAVLNVWLTLNHRLLSSGAIELFNAVVELGESRVGT